MQLKLTTEQTQFKINPFLRWAGGKNWFLKYIEQQLPTNFQNYHEPFLGGGSVFFNLITKKRNYLSDLNSELIETFIEVRDNVEKVISQIKAFKNTEEDYY